MPAAIQIRLALPAEVSRAIPIDAATEPSFRAIGIEFALADDHPFVVAEHARWRRAAEHANLYLAIAHGTPIGFYALGRMDGAAYLDQLSVHPDHGRRGIGRALLEHACALLAARGEAAVLLTTYAHVPWNAPFYASAAFRVLPESAWGPELRALIEQQRAVLPAPQQRVAMLRRL